MIKRKSSSIGFFNKTILAINIIAVLFLLLSYMAPFTDPRNFWPISFFGLAYPALLLINVLFVVYWLLFRPKFALISFISILTGYSFLTGFIGFRESTAIDVPKSSEGFIRVMTYNVHNFKQYGDKNDVFTKEKILDIIRKEQPDVICFQEFFYREKGEYNFKKLIQEIINSSHYYFEPVADNGYEANGMATFSKFPIIEKGYIAFNNVRGNEAIFTDIERNNKIFRVYNVHFQSINFKPEDYKYIKNVTEKIETDVQSSRRIGGRLKSAFLKRSDQVKVIKEHAKSCKTPYLVAGDFNDTPISYTVNSMSEGLINSFRKKGSGFGITYNGDFPNFQIDYILVSPAFNIKNYRIVDQKLSDHYAVRTDLELN
ncbi:MAG: endonuclease/exonuclease/phosphatase family protein [Daejeonella sp.]